MARKGPGWTELAQALAAVAVAVSSDPELRRQAGRMVPAGWRLMMLACRGAAVVFGRLGIYAEHRYRATVTA